MQITKAMLIVTSLITASAHANTIRDLAQAQTNTMLFKSQIAEQEAKQKLSDLRNGVKSESASVSSSPSMSSFSTQQGMSQPVVAREPVVLSILGANNRMFATMMLTDGSRVEVKKGSSLPGGYSVMNIDIDRVVLKKDGKSFSAAYYQ